MYPIRRDPYCQRELGQDDAGECASYSHWIILKCRWTGQIWDIRTGTIFETLKYDHPVTALQFDTRKIVAAVGENGFKVRFFWLLVVCD